MHSEEVLMATISSPTPRGWAQPDGTPSREAPCIRGPLPGATALDEATDRSLAAKPGSAERGAKGGIEGLIGRRVAAATEHALDGPNQTVMRVQKPVWDVLCKYYFRLETSGWERLPE